MFNLPRFAPRSPLRFLSLLVAPSLLAFVAPLQAQDAPPVDSVARLEAVRVEVLRSRLLSDGPWAISIRTGADLRSDRSAALLGDALRALPGLQVQNRYNYAVGDRIAVRGFGGRAQFGVRGVRLLVDGIPATLPDGQSSLDHLDPSTLSRVELLRGPGAAFYGNSAGAVLAFETTLPEAGAPLLVRLRSGGGSHGLGEASVNIGGSLAQGSWSATVSRLTFDGFRGTSDGGTYGAASRWTSTGRARLPLAGGTLTFALSGLDLDAENPGSLPADRLDDETLPAWGFNVLQGTGKQIRQGQFGAAWAGDRVDLSAWAIDRELTNPIPNTVIGLDRGVIGMRAQLSGGEGDLRWSVAADAERQGDHRTNHDNERGVKGDLTLEQDETVVGLGAAAQLAWSRGALELNGALRLDRTAFRADDQFTAQGDPDDSGDRSLSALSPTLGVQWTGSERWSVFGSIGSFFETPTTTELVNRPDGSGGFNPDLDPRRGWNAEVGLRSYLIEGGDLGFSAEVVAFGARIRDELVPFEVANQPGRTFFRNAGESRHYGVEAALRLVTASGVDGALAWTRVNARFNEGPDNSSTGDNRVPGVAPSRVEANLNWVLDGFNVGLDMSHNGEIPVDDAGLFTSEGSTLLDLRFGSTLVVGDQRFSPWMTIRNLTDERWTTSVVVNAFGGRYFEPGPGRTFDVGMSVLLSGAR